MQQKALGALVLCVTLLFITCEENLMLDPDITDKNRKEEAVPNNLSEREESAAVINEEDNKIPAMPTATELGQELEGVKPFDAAVFNTQKAAWEAEHPGAYNFTQTHRRSQHTLYMFASTTVVDDIPDRAVWPFPVPGLPGEAEWYPFLLCNTISGLYEKIDALWTEQRYTSESLLIKYDDQLNYPTAIQIKNVNDSGYDYLAQIMVLAYGDGINADEDGNVWGGIDLTIIDTPEHEAGINTDEDGNVWGGIVLTIIEEKFDMDRLHQEKAAWEAQGINSYRFTIKELLDIPAYPITIKVTEGMERVVEEKGKHDPDAPHGLYGKTISDIYTGIENVVEEIKEANTKEGYSLNFAVRYNEQYHYPEYFFVSPCYNGEVLDGGGTGVEISAFEIATGN
jgi:hypothetical protein